LLPFKKVAAIVYIIIVEVSEASPQPCLSYFNQRESDLATAAGRFAMLSEFVEIERTLRVARDITNGMRVAMARTLGLPYISDAWTGRDAAIPDACPVTLNDDQANT
jgi:hypothetical protein